MAHQNTNLMDTFKNGNEAIKALAIHFVQTEIDYDCFINENVLFNVSLIFSIFRQCLS